MQPSASVAIARAAQGASRAVESTRFHTHAHTQKNTMRGEKPALQELHRRAKLKGTQMQIVSMQRPARGSRGLHCITTSTTTTHSSPSPSPTQLSTKAKRQVERLTKMEKGVQVKGRNDKVVGRGQECLSIQHFTSTAPRLVRRPTSRAARSRISLTSSRRTA